MPQLASSVCDRGRRRLKLSLLKALLLIIRRSAHAATQCLIKACLVHTILPWLFHMRGFMLTLFLLLSKGYFLLLRLWHQPGPMRVGYDGFYYVVMLGSTGSSAAVAFSDCTPLLKTILAYPRSTFPIEIKSQHNVILDLSRELS